MRHGGGPSLIEASVVRIDPHSSSDDHRKYRDQADLQTVNERDPILRTERYLLHTNCSLLTKSQLCAPKSRQKSTTLQTKRTRSLHLQLRM